MAKSRQHPFDAILIWKFSRFARNQEESIVYKSLLRKNKVEVISISEPLAEGPFGSLIERIIEWMDEYYSIRLSDEVKRGMTENALRGNYQAGAPYGYMIAHKGESPTILPNEADIVIRIFEMYVYEKCSPFMIARQLNLLGYRTKRGNLFESRTIRYILKNPIYAGYTRWNMHDKSNGSIIKKSPEEWIVVKGNVPAIISDALFQQAQKQLNTTSSPCAKPITQQKHWLSGMIKCSACHRSLSVSQTSNKTTNTQYINFQCSGYLKGKCLSSHSISEKRLLPAILQSLDTITQYDSRCFTLAQTPSRQKDTAQTKCEHLLQQIEKKKERAKSAYLAGIDTLEEYQIMKQQLLKEEKEITLELEKASSENTALPNSTCPPLTLPCNIANVLIHNDFSFIHKHTAFSNIVKEIVFYKEEYQLKIVFRFCKDI